MTFLLRRLPRWLNRWYAKAVGSYWLPCAICGREHGRWDEALEALIDLRSTWAYKYPNYYAGQIGRVVCGDCKDRVRVENEIRAAAIVAKGGEIIPGPTFTLAPGESIQFVIPLHRRKVEEDS